MSQIPLPNGPPTNTHCNPTMSSQHDTNEELEHVDPIAFREKHANLVMKLKERTQHPSPKDFCMDDFVGTEHITCGKGVHKQNQLVIIQWNGLNDFILGKQRHLCHSCKFTKEVIR